MPKFESSWLKSLARIKDTQIKTNVLPNIEVLTKHLFSVIDKYLEILLTLTNQTSKF